MKIKHISVDRENLLLTRPYTIAFKTIDAVENGIIRISSDSGLTGYGAFNPSYEVIGEKLEDGLSVLSESNLDWLIGRELEDIQALCAEVQQKFAGSVCARIGLEIALYDLYTQGLGIPLVDFLGRRIDRMPTSVTIGIKTVPETLEEAKEYIGRKFRILKVKLGISLEEDVERLVKLREEWGDRVEIIIDANQGYNEEQLARFYKHIEGLNIGLIEQPLKAGEEERMRALPLQYKELLAADESLIDYRDALNLAEAPGACGFFNIKLMKCGGISQALRIAAVADAHDIGLMWGCNDESIISITAALHTAFSCAHTRYIDLDGSLDLARDVVTGGFILEDGFMSIPDRPGLGLQSA